MMYLYLILFSILILVSLVASIAILIFNTYSKDISNIQAVRVIISNISKAGNLTIQEDNNRMLHNLLKNITK